MKKHILLLLFVVFSFPIVACTTAVLTGRATVDGRPLLYKQRDTGFLDNKVMAFTDGIYTYMGIVNSVDVDGNEVWGGHNSAGFAIMNSASYNLNPVDENEKPELEGVIMKLALQKCRTLKDFETLLDTLPKPMHLSANFGVIDAEGGAAYFETGDYHYKKYDANEAEDGYLIRTNFSYSGDRERDLGLSRCEVATNLFAKKIQDKSLSYSTIFHAISRSLQHGIVDVNLLQQMPNTTEHTKFVPFRDFVPRYSTSSSMVVQGVKRGENPSLTVMWTMLGSPLTTVAIPLLLTPELKLPQIVLADKTGNAPLCTWSLELKKRLFPITRGEGKDYLDLAQLIAKDQRGIMQKVEDWEAQILRQAEAYVKKWRQGGSVDAYEYTDLCNFIDRRLEDKYRAEIEQRKTFVR